MQRQDGLELIRVGGAMALPAILRDLGADADAIIAAAGLGPEILADPENVIPFLTLGHLLEQVARATQSRSHRRAPRPEILDPSRSATLASSSRIPRMCAARSTISFGIFTSTMRAAFRSSRFRKARPPSATRSSRIPSPAPGRSSILRSQACSTSCAGCAARPGSPSKSACRARGRETQGLTTTSSTRLCASAPSTVSSSSRPIG